MHYKIRQDIIKKCQENSAKFIERVEIPEIMKTAESNWVDYQATEKEVNAFGIDGSLKLKKLKGSMLYVYDALATNASGDMLPIGIDSCGVTWHHNRGKQREEQLARNMMEVEIATAKQALSLAVAPQQAGSCLTVSRPCDLLEMDGSADLFIGAGVSKTIRGASFLQNQAFIHSIREHSYTLDAMLRDGADLVRQQEKTILLFISKSPQTNKQFKNDEVADIYYYVHGKQNAGFSVPYQDADFLRYGATAVESYVRLKDNVPVIKVELLNTSQRSLSDEEMRVVDREIMPAILDRLVYLSIKGYPACLNMAHQTAKITRDDMREIATYYGLGHDSGVRDVLGESDDDLEGEY